jgi:hypothetical protein
MSSNALIDALSMDRIPKYLENETPHMFRAKEASDYLNVTNSY